MAVEHPVAGVVGDKGDLDGFTRRHQNRIPPLPPRGRLAVAADDAEAVAVQMHRMPPRRLVTQGQHAALAVFERDERWHVVLAIANHRHAVHRPGRAGHAHHAHPHHALAAHHAALQRDLMADGGSQIRLGQGVGGQPRQPVWQVVAG